MIGNIPETASGECRFLDDWLICSHPEAKEDDVCPYYPECLKCKLFEVKKKGREGGISQQKCKFCYNPWWRSLFAQPKCKKGPGKRQCWHFDYATECIEFSPKFPDRCRFFAIIGKTPICTCKEGNSITPLCLTGRCSLFQET